MFEADAVLFLSVFLFCIGLVGAYRQTDLLKTFISLEIAVLASIMNFAFHPVDSSINSEHITILIAVILGCLTFSVIFAIIHLIPSRRDIL
ncbi:MAG: hypothetical protein LBJ77_02180 [Holosporales bacterium]|nr:hypothetical protein [Holosporales bacterium]